MTGSTTIADLLPLAAARHALKTAVTYRTESGRWVSKSFAELGDIVRDLSLGLIELGVSKGDKVAILANTRPEWTYYDFAALTAGAVVVPIYQTNSAEECRYVLENSDAQVLIVEDSEQLAKIAAVRKQLPKLEHVVVMVGSGKGAISTDALIRGGAERTNAEWERRWRSVTPEDICKIIYTSGTTGAPKGCVISHGNYRAMVSMALDGGVLDPDTTTYLFLPLAHTFALLIQLLNIDLGCTLAYWQRDPKKIVEDLGEVNPHYLPAVPRIFEKVYAIATGKAEAKGGIARRILDWGIRIGRRVRERERAGTPIGPLLAREHALAEKLVLSKIRAPFGRNIRYCYTGAAPIDPEILRFFDAAGVLILEGWGMTETSTAASVCRRDAFKFGTIGKAFTGCEVKVAGDGEILVRGPNVFQGYYKNPEATAETLIDGWLHTGDVGEIDAEGFITITGRKKDLIITAGGKNITPSNIEGEIRRSRWISECVVIGDRRPYLVALLTLDMDECAKPVAENGWPSDPAALAGHDGMRALIQTHIDQVNRGVGRVEQVKRFAILPADLSQETGELTPTLKVKRNVVEEKNQATIEGLYAG